MNARRHTERTGAATTAAPSARQPRERAVQCRQGCGRTTWNIDARCDTCGTTTGKGATRG